jgi:hypothetical protein
MQCSFSPQYWLFLVFNLLASLKNYFYICNLIKPTTLNFSLRQKWLLLPWLLLCSLTAQALSAKSTNIIEGSAPYLTFDGGRTKATNMDMLLSIKLSDDRVFTPQTNTSSATNPIRLPNVGESFANIDMFVPVNTNSIALNSLIGPPNNYWRDDDGDGQGVNEVSATGALTVSITDKNNQLVARNKVLTAHDAPYKVTLANTSGTLSTRYGVPNSSPFNASSATYYISPKVSPQVSFVRPYLKYGNGENAGPPSIWNPDKGFLVQSTNPSSYDLNFPTTGAHYLFFDLDIVGSEPLSWDSVTHSGITAIMTPDLSGTSVRVTLIGPHATSTEWNSSSPGNILRPSLPATFELVGRDSGGNAVIKYGFVLKQWFVNRGSKYDSASNQEAWCNSIGYSLPRVRDLTNASDLYGDGFIGATPSSSDNYYQRHINAGFFTEWGSMGSYPSARFTYYGCWTSDTAGSSQFDVLSNIGEVSKGEPKSNRFVVCASSLRP